MTTQAILAHGTLFQREGTPGVYTTVAEVKDMEISGATAERVEATSHGSPGRYREYVAGLIEGGEITLTLNFIPSNSGHLALKNDLDSGTVRGYRFIFPDVGLTQYDVDGIVTGFGIMIPVDGLLEADVTLSATGPSVIS